MLRPEPAASKPPARAAARNERPARADRTERTERAERTERPERRLPRANEPADAAAQGAPANANIVSSLYLNSISS